MVKKIQKVNSKTENGTTYDIRLGEDYRIYCMCPAWRFSKPPIKECKHLRDLFTIDGEAVMFALQKPAKNDRNDLYIRRVVLD